MPVEDTNRKVIVPMIEKVKIWELQYVDFVDLLPDNNKLSDSPIVFFRTKDDDIVFDAKKNNKRVQLPQVWLQSFATYAAVLTSLWPSHAGEIFQYMGDILNLAQQHPWYHVYSYDMSFRWSVQMDPNKNWAIMDHVILA